MRKADLAKQLAETFYFGTLQEGVRAIYRAKEVRCYRMFQKFVADIIQKEKAK